MNHFLFLSAKTVFFGQQHELAFFARFLTKLYLLFFRAERAGAAGGRSGVEVGGGRWGGGWEVGGGGEKTTDMIFTKIVQNQKAFAFLKSKRN